MSMIVVGNAPSLAGSEMGTQIDACDRVVRLNNFVTDGHENDVGCRTTDWVVNWGNIQREPPGDCCRVWLWVPPHIPSGYLEKYSRLWTPLPVILVPYAAEWIAGDEHPLWGDGVGPSLGIIVLRAALLMGCERPVRFCGIGEMDKMGKHYWELDAPENRQHAETAEREWLADVVAAGYIAQVTP
jgi:hypothetical protein